MRMRWAADPPADRTHVARARFKKSQAIANGLLCAGMCGMLLHTASKM